MSTWKCVIRFRKTDARIPFYASFKSKAKHAADTYIDANDIDMGSIDILGPVEVFKQGVPYDTAV